MFFPLVLLLLSCSSLWPHGLQHARLLCLSLLPWVCSNSCALSRWCYLTISSSVSPSSSCPQSFPGSGSFAMSRLFTSGGQSIGVSAIAAVLPKYSQGWFSLGCTDLISLQSKGLSRVFSSTTMQRHQFFGAQSSFFMVQFSPYMTSGKNIALIIQAFGGKVISLLFNMLSRFVITFLPRTKHLLISWLQSPSTGILEPKKRKSVTASTFSPSICHEAMGPDSIILVF